MEAFHIERFANAVRLFVRVLSTIFAFHMLSNTFNAAKFQLERCAASHLLLSSQIRYNASQTPSSNINLCTFFADAKILGFTDLNMSGFCLRVKLETLSNLQIFFRRVQSQDLTTKYFPFSSNWKTINFIEWREYSISSDKKK